MAVVEVNIRLLKELEGLGFSRARAAWALHYTGNSSLEGAVNWIIDHENDSQFDTMPLVEFNIEIKSPSPSDTAEAINARVKELREQARKKREEEEKKHERDREKERIQAGKEFSEAKRIAEENQRKRNIALKKAEKEEEKKAREKVLQKLDSDKLERRRRLGLRIENAAAKPSTAVTLDNENFVRRKLVSQLEMRECLMSMKRNYKDEDSRIIKRAFQTLLVLVKNVAKNPDEEKYRRIRLTNPLFHERVGRFQGGIEFLELCGFKRDEESEFLYLPRDEVDASRLREAAFQLTSAITNPFFGIFSKES